MRSHGSKRLPWIATVPWTVGIVLGVTAFLLIRFGIDDGPVAKSLAPLAWVVLLICWLAALASFIASAKRRQLLDAQTGLDSLGAMSWREFELLVGEAFRRRGWHVEETGLSGADGGVDLILNKDGHRELVQCKQWRSLQVGVAVVREMWGLANHHGVNGIKVVSLGNFTGDAMEFAHGKPIELINGAALLALIREVQAVSAASPATATFPTAPSPQPNCPRCGAAMVERRNRANATTFWGCTAYPKCRGTRAS